MDKDDGEDGFVSPHALRGWQWSVCDLKRCKTNEEENDGGWCWTMTSRTAVFIYREEEKTSVLCHWNLFFSLWLADPFFELFFERVECGSRLVVFQVYYAFHYSDTELYVVCRFEKINKK